MCLHPDVSKYVANIVDSVHRLGDKVDKVTVVILTPDRRPVERFVIEVGTDHHMAGQTDHLMR